jgi:hypothetical protein
VIGGLLPRGRSVIHQCARHLGTDRRLECARLITTAKVRAVLQFPPGLIEPTLPAVAASDDATEMTA